MRNDCFLGKKERKGRGSIRGGGSAGHREAQRELAHLWAKEIKETE